MHGPKMSRSQEAVIAYEVTDIYKTLNANVVIMEGLIINTFSLFQFCSPLLTTARKQLTGLKQANAGC